jgi:hypothetical protein
MRITIIDLDKTKSNSLDTVKLVDIPQLSTNDVAFSELIAVREGMHINVLKNRNGPCGVFGITQIGAVLDGTV